MGHQLPARGPQGHLPLQQLLPAWGWLVQAAGRGASPGPPRAVLLGRGAWGCLGVRASGVPQPLRAPACPHPLSAPRGSLPRPYSLLQACLEGWADHLHYGYPNALAEQYIFQSHHRYFHNCTVEHQVYFDPPEDVLLAMIIAPICLIPFLVTLVIWRSKDGKAQP
ncbi:hypothetical protein QYF61_020158 [Mycteria americana]|uniref:Receptor activity modifying protein 2 n=1 Tax=Mycteria americana TaxID=33587 RepID=A0AAN7RJ19_MYCAM|nr:hypothetical protein QYF61_020158 [Mycteria americana]